MKNPESTSAITAVIPSVVAATIAQPVTTATIALPIRTATIPPVSTAPATSAPIVGFLPNPISTPPTSNPILTNPNPVLRISNPALSILNPTLPTPNPALLNPIQISLAPIPPTPNPTTLSNPIPVPHISVSRIPNPMLSSISNPTLPTLNPVLLALNPIPPNPNPTPPPITSTVKTESFPTVGTVRPVEPTTRVSINPNLIIPTTTSVSAPAFTSKTISTGVATDTSKPATTATVAERSIASVERPVESESAEESAEFSGESDDPAEKSGDDRYF